MLTEREITLVIMILLLGITTVITMQDIKRLHIQAQESDLWAQRWEEIAQQANEETEAIAQRHARLQALYCNLVRAQLAANWPLVLQHQRRQSE